MIDKKLITFDHAYQAAEDFARYVPYGEQDGIYGIGYRWSKEHGNHIEVVTYPGKADELRAKLRTEHLGVCVLVRPWYSSFANPSWLDRHGDSSARRTWLRQRGSRWYRANARKTEIYNKLYRLLIKKELWYFFRYEIPDFIHRGRHGWAKSDTWSFDMYLAPIIRDGCRYLARHAHGHPVDMTFEEWVAILNKIADGFDSVVLACDAMTEDDVYTPEYREAMDLFKEHFVSLWS